MEPKKTESDELDDEDEDEEDEPPDLYDNKRRQSLSSDGARRMSLGLPDNGAGLTKDYYNIKRAMSVTSLVDLIIMRRAGIPQERRRGSSQLPEDLEENIKKTLAWKEMEDELNKEDVMVTFRKKMREMRKEARQSTPKERKTERKVNEERRVQLRTTLLQPSMQRRSTTESIKEAIQEFRMRQPAIIEETQVIKTDYEGDREVADIVQKTRQLLEELGYIKQRKIEGIEKETLVEPKKEVEPVEDISAALPAASNSNLENGSKKKRIISRSGSEKSLSENIKSGGARPRSNIKIIPPLSPLNRKEEWQERREIIVVPLASPTVVLPRAYKTEWDIPRKSSDGTKRKGKIQKSMDRGSHRQSLSRSPKTSTSSNHKRKSNDSRSSANVGISHHQPGDKHSGAKSSSGRTSNSSKATSTKSSHAQSHEKQG